MLFSIMVSAIDMQKSRRYASSMAAGKNPAGWFFI